MLLNCISYTIFFGLASQPGNKFETSDKEHISQKTLNVLNIPLYGLLCFPTHWVNNSSQNNIMDILNSKTNVAFLLDFSDQYVEIVIGLHPHHQRLVVVVLVVYVLKKLIHHPVQHHRRRVY